MIYHSLFCLWFGLLLLVLFLLLVLGLEIKAELALTGIASLDGRTTEVAGLLGKLVGLAKKFGRDKGGAIIPYDNIHGGQVVEHQASSDRLAIEPPARVGTKWVAPLLYQQELLRLFYSGMYTGG